MKLLAPHPPFPPFFSPIHRLPYISYFWITNQLVFRVTVATVNQNFTLGNDKVWDKSLWTRVQSNLVLHNNPCKGKTHSKLSFLFLAELGKCDNCFKPSTFSKVAGKCQNVKVNKLTLLIPDSVHDQPEKKRAVVCHRNAKNPEKL